MKNLSVSLVDGLPPQHMTKSRRWVAGQMGREGLAHLLLQACPRPLALLPLLLHCQTQLLERLPLEALWKHSQQSRLGHALHPVLHVEGHFQERQVLGQLLNA
jgi:hypothetical protein